MLPRIYVAAVFFLALAVRLAAFAIHGHSLVFAKYLEASALLAEGRLDEVLRPDFSPLYLELHALPLRLGLVPDLLALPVAQIILGSLTCALTAAIGARLAGPVAGTLAGVIVAIQRDLVIFDQVLEPETLLLFLVTAALWLLVSCSGRLWAYLVAGLLLALAGATRPSALLVFIAFVAMAWPGPWLVVAKRLCLLGLGLLLAGLALRVGLEAPPMSPGPVAFTGNNPQATGVWRADFLVKDMEGQTRDPALPDHAHQVFRDVAKASLASDPDRYWLDLAVAFVREYPGRWLVLVAEKALALGQPHDPHDLATSIKLKDRLASWPLLGAWPLLAFGVVGLARRRLWKLCLVAISLAATCLVFYTSARYRCALMPWVAVGAATVVLGALPRRLRGSGDWLRALAAVGLSVLFALPLPPGYLLAKEDQDVRATHPLYAQAARLRAENRYLEAAALLEACVAKAPWFADLYALAEVPLPLEAIGARHAPEAIAKAQNDARGLLGAAMLAEFAHMNDVALDLYARCEEAAIWPGEGPVVRAARLRRGALLLSLGRNAEARKAFEQALDLAPGDPEALVGLYAAGGGEEALEAAERVNPRLYVRFLLGQWLLDTGRPREAIGPLGEVVAALPSWPRARMLYALALAGANDKVRAAREAKKAQGLFPELFDPFHRPVSFLCDLALESGRREDLERCATFAAIYGDLQAALGAWGRLEETGLTPDEEARVGFLLLRYGRINDAVARFGKALAADPTNPRALAGMAEANRLSREGE